MKKTGISKSDSKFDRYTGWLEQGGLEYVVLDWEKNNFDDIKQCSSLILTGGVDIFPEFYNDWEDGKHRDDYLPERDGFEFKLIDHAFANNLPILGICRGLQIINSKLNGSLINDIETIRGTNHRKISPAEDRMHHVNVSGNSLLFEVVNEMAGDVNSSHHQAIDRVGEGLRVTAKADDGIIEAVEWDDRTGKPFMLCIQWHPERVVDRASPFSKNIFDRFKLETEKN
jgi:putative glutamine amidotransferase